VIQRLTGEFANNANLNFDVLTALMPSNVGVQMMGATKESSEDESKRGSFSVMAMTRMIESVVQHPKVKKELVMPTMLRVVPESEIESEVVPAADISKSTGAAFKPEKRLSKLDAKPLKGPEATTTAFVPTEPKTETTDAHNPKAATTTVPMEAQKTRSLTEEEKVYLEIERVRRILFKMDIKELMEIRGYPNPPAGLEPLLKCNLVLLGHSEATLKSWADIKKKIQKAAEWRDAMLNFKTETLAKPTVDIAQKHLSPLSDAGLRRLSRASIVVYDWCNVIMKEFELYQKIKKK